MSQYEHTLDYQFSEEQKKFLFDNGYLVIEGMFSEEQCDRLYNEIKQRLLGFGYDTEDSETWKIDHSGFFDVWHCPTFYEMRQDPRLYSIFAQLLRRHDIICSIDRVSVKPPYYLDIEVNGKKMRKTFAYFHNEFPIHNDMNLWHLETRMYQAGICLLDCPKGHGGFRCVPKFHKLDNIRKYRKDCLEGKYGLLNREPPPESCLFNWFLDNDLIKKECIEIPMKKGDYVIWNSRLPHSNSVNMSNSWRIHCFIQFVQSDFNPEYNQVVKYSVETGKKPSLFPSGTQTDKSNLDHEMQFQQQIIDNITPLGRKIFGIEPW